jgi:hypothetical protein
MSAGDVLRALQAARDEQRIGGVELEGLRTLPGTAVRLSAAGLGLLVPIAAGFATMRGPIAFIGAGLAVLLALLVLIRPRTGWAAWLIVLGGLRLLLGGALPPLQLAGLLLVVHLALLASMLAARLEPGSRVEVAVPATMLRTAWPLQVGAQVVGLLVWLLGASRALPGAALWRVVALAAAVAVLVLVLPSGRRTDGDS